jgi:hypothetical protein
VRGACGVTEWRARLVRVPFWGRARGDGSGSGVIIAGRARGLVVRCVVGVISWVGPWCILHLRLAIFYTLGVEYYSTPQVKTDLKNTEYY